MRQIRNPGDVRGNKCLESTTVVEVNKHDGTGGSAVLRVPPRHRRTSRWIFPSSTCWVIIATHDENSQSRIALLRGTMSFHHAVHVDDHHRRHVGSTNTAMNAPSYAFMERCTWSESSRCRTQGSWVQSPPLPVSIWMSIVPACGRVSLLRGAR